MILPGSLSLMATIGNSGSYLRLYLEEPATRVVRGGEICPGPFSKPPGEIFGFRRRSYARHRYPCLIIAGACFKGHKRGLPYYCSARLHPDHQAGREPFSARTEFPLMPRDPYRIPLESIC
jgi:hypothetical protein